MKVVILAGGLPSTISDDNDRVPKPMVTIGERPILWHIMKMYSHYGFNDFIICTGYRADLIKEYFLNYYIYRSDITVDLKTNDVEIHNKVTEDWNVTIVDTGLESLTAERVLRIKDYVRDEDFIVVFGDCISDINVNDFVSEHKKSGKIMTLAMAKPTGRNTIIPVSRNSEVIDFSGGFSTEEAWANANNMVVSGRIFDDSSFLKERLEVESINELAKKSQVQAFKHHGFWVPVETMRDKLMLEAMWSRNEAVWKIWND